MTWNGPSNVLLDVSSRVVMGILLGPPVVPLIHVGPVHEGEWLAKPLLATKLHQENVTDIADFVWRFCVSYVASNAVMIIIAMPIPRCDTAVGMSFRGSQFRWLMDAISGYNQIHVAKSSQEKLVFAGPNCTKYTYFVMPFGPVNGPVIFIVFIHDMDATWKYLASSCLFRRIKSVQQFQVLVPTRLKHQATRKVLRPA